MKLSENAKKVRRGRSRWVAPGVLHPWDRERQRPLTRRSPRGTLQKLDLGVNYFIRQLEKLGCKTLWSCEGHPDDFYIMFRASYPVARKISRCGFLEVSISGNRNQFSLRHNFKKTDDRPNTAKRKILRWAAMSWEEGLGPLRKKTL